MRIPSLFAALLALSACGGPSAEVTGSAIGVSWGETSHVFYGGPFLVISNSEIDCEGVSWVKRNYEEGQAPTDDDVQILQFAFATDDLKVGSYSVAIDASVSSTVLEVKEGTFTFERAGTGFLYVDDVADEATAEGSFEGVVFDSGTLDGTYTAEWCRNLKG